MLQLPGEHSGVWKQDAVTSSGSHASCPVRAPRAAATPGASLLEVLAHTGLWQEDNSTVGEEYRLLNQDPVGIGTQGPHAASVCVPATRFPLSDVASASSLPSDLGQLIQMHWVPFSSPVIWEGSSTYLY